MTKQKTSYKCPHCEEIQSQVNLEQKIYRLYHINLKTKYSEMINTEALNDDDVYFCPECKGEIEYNFIKDLL